MWGPSQRTERISAVRGSPRRPCSGTGARAPRSVFGRVRMPTRSSGCSGWAPQQRRHTPFTGASSPAPHQRPRSIRPASREPPRGGTAREQRCVRPTHAIHMSKTSTRPSSDYRAPRGATVGLALHGARPASVDRVGLGEGCWPVPRPARLTSDASVIDPPVTTGSRPRPLPRSAP